MSQDYKIAFTRQTGSAEYPHTQFLNKDGHFIWAHSGVCTHYTSNSAVIISQGQRFVYVFNERGLDFH